MRFREYFEEEVRWFIIFALRWWPGFVLLIVLTFVWLGAMQD